ncbi:MAG: hypothetical protein V1898_04215 [Patescibacteria group bacterium]
MNKTIKKSYKLGFIYLESKPLLKKIGIIILYALAISAWLYFFIQLGTYIINYKSTKAALADIMIDYVNYDIIPAPINLKISEAYLLSRNDGKYDLIAQIENPNTHWIANNFEYQFNINGFTTTTQTSYLLPQEKKNLTFLNLALNNINTFGQNEASLQVISEPTWKGKKQVYPELIIDFTDSSLTNIDLEEKTYARVTTTAQNNSLYGFKNIQILAVVKSQGAPVGIAVSNITNFLSSDTKQLEFSWPRKFPFDADLKFFATTDIRSENNLIVKNISN